MIRFELLGRRGKQAGAQEVVVQFIDVSFEARGIDSSACWCGERGYFFRSEDVLL